MGQTVSIIVPIHEKPKEVLEEVQLGLESQGEEIDQLIVVMDRVPADPVISDDDVTQGWLEDGFGLDLIDYPQAISIKLDGSPGWRSPCIAANAGLKEITGEITIYNPSDIVQAPGNIAFIKDQMATHPAVYFAKVLESKPEECMGPGHAGPVLCSSDNPRPLTFLFAAPTEAMRSIGGWDEAFQDGVCYEDDDLTARLWKHGLDFIFDDRFNGIHQSHSRAYFKPIPMSINQAHMLRKHGTLRVYDRERAAGRLVIEREMGRTIFRHA